MMTLAEEMMMLAEEMMALVEVFLLAKTVTAAILAALDGLNGTDQLEFKVSHKAMMLL